MSAATKITPTVCVKPSTKNYLILCSFQKKKNTDKDSAEKKLRTPRPLADWYERDYNPSFSLLCLQPQGFCFEALRKGHPLGLVTYSLWACYQLSQNRFPSKTCRLCKSIFLGIFEQEEKCAMIVIMWNPEVVYQVPQNTKGHLSPSLCKPTHP